MHLLTPKGIAQKLQFTAYFLQRKEREFEKLRGEIAHLRVHLRQSDPGTVAVITATPSGESSLLSKSAPVIQTA